MPLFILHYWKT
jgi:hypothetical protein